MSSGKQWSNLEVAQLEVICQNVNWKVTQIPLVTIGNFITKHNRTKDAIMAKAYELKSNLKKQSKTVKTTPKVAKTEAIKEPKKRVSNKIRTNTPTQVKEVKNTALKYLDMDITSMEIISNNKLRVYLKN